jgi:glycosyltransferase involved in cell wall biosynthesis
MSEPIVSIVTATRNRTDLLERALRSIAAQAFDEYEAILVDDGSSAEVQRFQRDLVSELGERFRLISSAAPDLPGTGCSAARNRGAAAARGRFLTFLDDDDRWIRSDHLQVASALMDRFEADYYIAKIQGEEKGEVLLKEVFYEYSLPVGTGRIVSEVPLVHEISRDDVLKMSKYVLIHPDNSLIRRSTFERVHGFVSRLTWREDFNLMLRIVDTCGRILYRPDVVAGYRFARGDSISFSYNEPEKYLQNLYGANHVRMTCKSSAVRSAARADEAWSCRNIARLLAANGEPAEALLFSWQGFTTFPTLGAAKDLLTSLTNMARRR